MLVCVSPLTSASFSKNVLSRSHPNETTCDTLEAGLSDVKDSDFELVPITVPTAHITAETKHSSWVLHFCGVGAG